MLLTGSPLPLFIEFSEIMKGSCYFSKVFDKSVVEVAETNEFSDSFDISGWLPIIYGFYLYTFHFKSIGRQFHTKEVDFVLMEFTLLWVQGDAHFPASL